MNIKFTLFVLILAIAGSSAQVVDSSQINTTSEVSNTLFAKRTFTNHFFGANHSLLDFEDYRGGFELNYARNLVDNIDISFPFRVNVIRLPEEISNRKNFSLDGLMHVHYDKEATIDPYLLVGAGAVLEPGSSTDVQIPLGAGINVKLNKVLRLNIQSEFRLSVSGERNNYVHGVGLGLNLNELLQPVIIEAPEVQIEDRDGDGISDATDECPDVKGNIAFNGCPDSDNDGIGDQEDACPDLAGSKEFRGCPDTDGDGLSDVDDDCPDQAGPKDLLGCPDTDGDGIKDSDDKCPNEKGIVENNGCPKAIADQDNDGVPDEEDECPTVKGTLKGCPDDDNDGVKNSADNCPQLAGPVNAKGCPDSDDDGLDDYNDKCPNKPGPLANSGCPEISAEDKATLEFAVQAVNFQTGSAELTAASFPVLSKITDILKRYPAYDLVISGHTDSTGEAEKNQILSQARAEACRNYLRDQGGINTSRMSAIGYGQNQPKASNETLEGRLMNRRVEFDLRLK